MIRKKSYIILILLALVMACFCTRAYAQQGTSCQNPIVLQNGYSETITGPCSKWYIANTYDLPMAIDFYPSDPSSSAPDLELDFGCTPGVYEDRILCNLFCKTHNTNITMPYHETPPMSYDTEGNARYHVEFGTFYRDLLLKQGIDYNIEVFIKVIYHGAGLLQMDPNPFNNCMDGHKFMHYGDTVNVVAMDKERHVIVPYVQWQYDSIRYVWNGTTPCTIAIGNSCGFDPTDAEDATIMDGGVVQPGGEFKVSSALLMRYVSDKVNYPNDAGMYFAKFYSAAPGVMTIEKIPAPPPSGGATLLKYGEATRVNKNDTAKVYAMPDSWIQAMQFTTPTDHIFKMYIGQTPTFYTKDAFAVYQFDRTVDGHALSLIDNELSSIWSHKKKGENYLYVRFECTDNTTVLPLLWAPSDCMKKLQRIKSGIQFEVSAKSNTNYSLYYADWKDGNMTIAWTSTQSECFFYIADTCDVPNSNVSPVFYTNKAPKKNSVTIPANTVNGWESHVDPDGYLYIRFYSQGKGKITATTSAPEEQDPPCATPEDSILSVTAWDSYEWNGVTYTETGVYTKDGNVDAETGCMDSLYTLRLIIHTTTINEETHAGCDEVVVNETTYTADADVVDTVYDAAGNRTITTYHIRVGRSYDITLPDTTVCVGDFVEGYLFVDTLITTSGTYTRHLKTVRNCDSILTQTVTILQETFGKDIVTAYDSYTWINCTTYYASTKGPVWYLPNAAGCDSIVSLNLTIKHLHLDTVRQTICASELPYEWYGKSCEAAGYHNADTIIAEEVDTVRTLDLTVLEESYSDTTAVACDVFTWYGKSYTQSGYPTRKLTNAVGCDSIITLNLTIHYSSSSEEYRSEYQSYTWNGETYRYSGTYIYQTTNVAGCDSTAILYLTVHQDTVVEYFCPKSGIVEHVDTLSVPNVSYLSYIYEKPRKEMYMDGVVSGETNEGANVDLARVLTNLDAYYVAPLAPVETINWRYMPFGGQSETLSPGAGPQWMNAGTISMDMIFRCGYRYYGSFTIGKMTEGMEMMTTEEQPTKRIENGQVVIIRNGKKYSIFGAKIE